MKKILISAAVLVLTAALVPEATAQSYYPTTRPGSAPRPALSPYFNLLRGGDPAANYYLGVLPERDRRATQIQYGTAIRDLEQRDEMGGKIGDDPLLTELPSTGHPTYFLNYSTYYNLGNVPRAPLQPPSAGGRRGR